MVCASADVGAPWVCAGPDARVDSVGKPACEICGRRLSKCKGKLYQHGPGKICSPCYKVREGYQAPPVSVASSPPARSHKRQAGSSPSAPSPQPVAALLPLVQPPLHLQLTFPTQGWSLQPGHRNSRALASSWLTLATSTELKRWEEKRGGFYQHDTHRSLVCSHLDELRVRLRASSEALGRSVLHDVEVDATTLQLVDIKLQRHRRAALSAWCAWLLLQAPISRPRSHPAVEAAQDAACWVQQRGCAAHSPMLPFAPCNPSSRHEAHSFLSPITSHPRMPLAQFHHSCIQHTR